MKKYISLLARIFLSAIFLKAGINKILDPAGTQEYMAAKGLPLTGLLLVATITVLIIGSLSILLGYKARWGALLLIGFLIPTTLIFHGNLPEDEVSFLKNLGLMGGLLMIFDAGPGPLSFDRRQSN